MIKLIRPMVYEHFCDDDCKTPCLTFKCQCPVPTRKSDLVCVCRDCHDSPWEVHFFSCVRAFDKHRNRPKGYRGKARCWDPASKGLVLKSDRPYLYWGTERDTNPDRPWVDPRPDQELLQAESEVTALLKGMMVS